MLRIEREPQSLLELIPQITKLADQEREALGFLPPSAFKDACDQRRLIAAIEIDPSGQREIAGYLLFGGLFPHARVYQVGVSASHRRLGVGSSLLRALVSQLEADGYLSLSARVAKDLEKAAAFYSSNGFTLAKEIAGGAARDRRLLVMVRRLDTSDLLSGLDENQSRSERLALALRASASGAPPIYVIDLNVLFDLIRNRSRSQSARRLFGAALAHRLRLAVSPEFVSELRRTSDLNSSQGDPVLQMALQLPQLVKPTRPKLEALAAQVHRIVFEDTASPAAGSSQSLSDSKHIAHSALGKASGFITSDGQLLAARDRLREEIGIDIASLNELLDLVPEDVPSGSFTALGQGFELVSISEPELRDYLSGTRASTASIEEFLTGYPGRSKASIHAIAQSGHIVAVSALLLPMTAKSAVSLFLHSDVGILSSDVYFDCLFDRAVAAATTHGPAVIELRSLASDASGSVEAFARSRGFLSTKATRTLFKASVGRPVTTTSWDKVALALFRRTDVRLSRPRRDESSAVLTLRSGDAVRLSFAQLEDFLGPTVIAWPSRPGVIQPITARYADELLGTAKQQSLLEAREAAFLSARSYASSPRSASRMTPGALIFFYESMRRRGRGAVVAVARVVDTLIVHKDAIPSDRARRIVVEDLSAISRSTEALLTTFDNLLVFPTPCPLDTLREFDAVGRQNLRTTTPVSEEAIRQILDFGWSDGTP